MTSINNPTWQVLTAHLGYVFVEDVGHDCIYIADIHEILASKEQLLLVVLL